MCEGFFVGGEQIAAGLGNRPWCTRSAIIVVVALDETPLSELLRCRHSYWQGVLRFWAAVGAMLEGCS